MGVLAALIYLRVCLYRNLLRNFLRRLREPKYLLGLGIGLAYFWFLLFRPRPAANRGPSMFGTDQTLQSVFGVLVTLGLLLLWFFSKGKPALGFTEAETAVLFQAPLTRRQLVHYRLLSNLLAGLIGAVFFMLFITRGQGGSVHMLEYWLAWWLLSSLVALHASTVAFTLSRWETNRWRFYARRVVCVLLAALVLLACWRQLPIHADNTLLWVLKPGRWLVEPFFAESTGRYLLLSAVLAVLVALHYWGMLQLAEVPFEEESLALTARRTAIAAQMKAGKGLRLSGKVKANKQPFELKRWMPVELVLLWKNLMLAPAYLNRWTFLGFVVLFSAANAKLHAMGTPAAQTTAMGIGGLSGMTLVYILLLGPQLARIDLRSDLGQADLLKVWPCRGWRIVLGTLLAPTVLMTGIGLVLIVAVTTGFSSGVKPFLWLTLPLKYAIGISGSVLLPVLIMLMLLAPNAMALYFPSWSQFGTRAGRGLDVMGMRMLLGLCQLVVLMLALFPVALVAGVTLYFSQWWVPVKYGIPLAAIAALIVLVLEILFVMHLLGERLEALDIAGELRQ